MPLAPQMLLDRGAKTFLHLYRATSEAPMVYTICTYKIAFVRRDLSMLTFYHATSISNLSSS